MSYLSKANQDRVLASLGLQRIPGRGSYTVPALGVLGVGLALGAGVALLFTPKTGREIRRDLGRQANRLGDTVRETVRNAVPKSSEWSTANLP